MDRPTDTTTRGIAGDSWPSRAPDARDGLDRLSEQGLLEYLQWYDRPISIEQLTIRLEAQRSRVRALLEPLDERGAVEITPTLEHVLVEPTDQPEAIADGAGPPSQDPPTPDVDLTLDELLEVLGARRRRDAIRVLDAFRTETESRDYVTVTELAHGVAAGQITLDKSTTSADVKPLYVSLKDNHVPRLDTCGLVDYRPVSRGSTLQPTPDLAAVAKALTLLESIAPEEDE